MNSIDVNAFRDLIIKLHGLSAVDREYVMYYDETNNIRLLRVRTDGLNSPNPKCFAVGGIAHHGQIQQLDLALLRSELRIQKTATEIKLKHIAKGDFLKLLESSELEVFLRWLTKQGHFIHYSVLDPLYWSIVDVVDSILGEHDEEAIFSLHRSLKNSLYTILRDDYEGTVDIFRRYTYPDVGREKRAAFVAELRKLLELRSDLLAHYDHEMLKGVLKIAENLPKLPFLEDEAPNILINSFGPFFVERICLFKNARHIFDVEDVIQEHLSGKEFRDGEDKLLNFRFGVSHDETGIQLSDVVIGLIGKMFSYICANDAREIDSARKNLSPQQERSLFLLTNLIDRSINENKAFALQVLSDRDIRKAESFLGW